jgi:hypothetical protein
MRARTSVFALSTLSATALLCACAGDDNVGAPPPAADAGSSLDGTVPTHPADSGSAGDVAVPPSDAGTTALKHIFYVMMENHGYAEIIGNTADAPTINQLANQYGLATSYYGVTHPSLPNYLAAVSGDFQGIWDDCAAGQSVTCAPEEFVPSSGDGTASELLTDAQVASATATPHWFSGQTLVDQLETAGMTWKAYMQGIPGVGATDEYAPVDSVDAGDGGVELIPRMLYAQKHDPFMYFSAIRGSATRLQQIVPFTQLATDLAAASTTPSFSWISPDQCHDMHGLSTDNATAVGIADCALPSAGLDHSIIALGDAFVKTTVQTLMAAPAWSEGSAIVIVWDEDDYTGWAGCCGSPTNGDGGQLGGALVPAIVITSLSVAHQTVTDPLNHYSMLATIESLWGLPCLANACSVPAKATKLFTP